MSYESVSNPAAVENAQNGDSLRRKIVWGFVVAILLTSTLGLLSWRNAQQAAHDADWVAHSHEVLTTLEIIIKHLGDVDTGGRGYAIPIRPAMSVANEIIAGRGSSTIHIGPTGFLGVLTTTSTNGPAARSWRRAPR